MDKDQPNTHGTPDGTVEADTASGGAPDKPDHAEEQGDSAEQGPQK